MSRKFTGIGVCPGVAFAPVYKIEIKESATDLDVTWQEISAALEKSAQYLEEKAQKIDLQVAKEVLEAQSLMARDPDLIEKIKNTMGDSKKSARNVLNSTLEEFKNNLLSLGDYFAERVADIDEIKKLTLNNIFGIEQIDLKINSNSIVVADDLSPADTASMNLNYVKGLVVAKGGPTSHTAIVARNLGIPAIVGCKDIEDLKNGVEVLINGRNGVVIENPDKNLVTQEINKENEFKAKFKSVSGPGKLKDNTAINLLANCGNIEDAKKAIINDAEGIGLFRTELLYLNQAHAPSISEQVKVYSEIFEIFQGKKVIIRTLDAGSDKPVPFLNSDKEENPALGVRGWRLIREFSSVIKDQIKAISIAQESGKCDVWVMAPMIDTADEALEFSNLAKENGIKKIGVMIETPAAAMVSDQIFEIVDFASFGTNDLTQYVMAADRLDSRLSDLTNSWHPAVLRTIEIVGKNAQGKPLGVCGEAAADPLLAAVLIGLGVNSLSMASNSIAEVKSFIANQDLEKCQNVAKEILKTKNAIEAKELAVKLFN